MRNKEELNALLTTYFGDRLSPTQIDLLVADVMMGTQNRRLRTYTRIEMADRGSPTASTVPVGLSPA